MHTDPSVSIHESIHLPTRARVLTRARALAELFVSDFPRPEDDGERRQWLKVLKLILAGRLHYDPTNADLHVVH